MTPDTRLWVDWTKVLLSAPPEIVFRDSLPSRCQSKSLAGQTDTTLANPRATMSPSCLMVDSIARQAPERVAYVVHLSSIRYACAQGAEVLVVLRSHDDRPTRARRAEPAAAVVHRCRQNAASAAFPFTLER